MQALIEIVLRGTGTYWRGRSNAARVVLKRNDVCLPSLPRSFEGFTILHLSDLHADISQRALVRARALLDGLEYDLCVLTGDFRGRTYGDYGPTLRLVAQLRNSLRGVIYGVLGNHDSIMMVPDLEALGITILLNESVAIRRGGEAIYLAGVDDAHFYRADNIEKAATEIPEHSVSILLSHTPEIYRQAAHTGFRPDAQRTHPRGANLPSRRRRHFSRSQTAARARSRTLETQSIGRLHLRRRRLIRGSSPLQHQTRNHVASSRCCSLNRAVRADLSETKRGTRRARRKRKEAQPRKYP